VLARVRDAERRILELQEHNERLTKEINVDTRVKTDADRHVREELDRQLRLTKEELQNKDQQLRVAHEDKGNAMVNERAKEVRRLETVVAGLRAREEALEGDLLTAQNEIVRLRFETEHSELRLQRWQVQKKMNICIYIYLCICICICMYEYISQFCSRRMRLCACASRRGTFWCACSAGR